MYTDFIRELHLIEKALRRLDVIYETTNSRRHPNVENEICIVKSNMNMALMELERLLDMAEENEFDIAQGLTPTLTLTITLTITLTSS